MIWQNSVDQGEEFDSNTVEMTTKEHDLTAFCELLACQFAVLENWNLYPQLARLFKFDYDVSNLQELKPA